MKLTFYGGAKTVTGANYLLETKKSRILIDCGLNQGTHYSEKLNFQPFAYDPKTIDYVLITHAHIDHIGRLPQLHRAGFGGRIFSTQPTKDFAEFLLYDSEHILREEAEKHKVPVLYEANDVAETMRAWQKVSYHEKLKLGDVEVEFYDAGHILGSSSIVVTAEGKKILFSGDLGNSPEILIRPTEYVENADYALIESAYGNRVHEGVLLRKEVLEDLIEETVKKGGVLMIPAFALERTQEMIYELDELARNGRIPRVPIFIDSPLAIKLTGVYQKYSRDPNYFSESSLDLIRSGDVLFDFPDLHLTLTTEQSKEINDVPPPKVIVAGAGMSNGGRILHPLHRLSGAGFARPPDIGWRANG
jgi:metallo-beta-lactamase family protein